MLILHMSQRTFQTPSLLKHQRWRRAFLCALLMLTVSLAACASREAVPLPPPTPSKADAFPPHEPLRSWPERPLYPQDGRLLPVPETWNPLLERFKADGLDGSDLRAFFIAMGDSYSHKPMGTKIKELYTYRYLRKPPTTPTPPASPDRVYPGFVTPAVAAQCKAYLEANKRAFDRAEELYHVPREVIAALLMVETKLGTYLGKDSAFWSLACMAAADNSDRILESIEALPEMAEDRMGWINEKLAQRSTWAYKELKALLEHVRQNNLDPLAMPGSVYGAIGICQFMPSNLKPYGADGNADGIIDLFDPIDAIPSVGNYLRGHGWKQTAMTRDQQHGVIKRYNNSTVYANTILALAAELQK